MSQDETPREKPSGNEPTSCNICAFMVAPQHKEVLWIFNFVAEQKQESL